jgi:hypothetical protein
MLIGAPHIPIATAGSVIANIIGAPTVLASPFARRLPSCCSPVVCGLIAKLGFDILAG